LNQKPQNLKRHEVTIGMEVKKLTDIPGVGPKVAEKLIDYFGSEESALSAIFDGRIADIASIPGIGRKLAVKIVMKAYEMREGVSPDTVLKTRDAFEIYENILRIIRSYARTDYGKEKLLLYFPLPSSKVNEILSRLKYFTDARNFVFSLDEQVITKISNLLSQMRSLKKAVFKKYISGRIVLVDSEELLQEIERRGLGAYCSVYLVNTPSEIMDFLRENDYVILVTRNPEIAMELEGAENLEVITEEDLSEEEIIPEKIVYVFASNRQTIIAACELADLLLGIGEGALIDRMRQEIEIEGLRKVKSLLEHIDENGELLEGLDEEYDRLNQALKNLDIVISEIEAEVNNKLRREITSRKAVISGEQLVKLLEISEAEASIDAIRRWIPDDIYDLFISTVKEAEEKLSKELNLSIDELQVIEGLFPQETTLPVQADRNKVRMLEDLLRKRYSIRKYKLYKRIAKEFLRYQDVVERAIKIFLDFDVFFAIGRFARDYELNPPDINMEYNGIAIINAKNVFLKEKELKGEIKVEPVTYVVGETPFKPPNTNGERIIILSGANSGGKTCLLQTLAQVVILAQMGFPVPAEKAHLRVFDEIHFYAKAKGMVDAGALETTLKRFSKIISSEESKLALFDELEAMTETSAAARIIAGIMDMLWENKNACAVFVSHLAQEIKKLTKAKIRVDGIEAEGLDENYNLIVNRSPRFNYLAKSTPELIIERLYVLSKDESERSFYEKLLSLFKTPS